MTTQFGNLVAISLICTVAFGLPLAWALWSALEKPRVSVVPSVLDAVKNIEEMDQPTFHLHALKGDRSLKEAAMRMKKPAHPGELVAANFKELGLSVVEAAKAIGVIRQQLYNVINGRSAVTPEMAVRFEKAFGGGADVWLRMQAPTTSRKCASPKERSEYDALPGRYDGSHFRPPLVERIASHDDRDWRANGYRGTTRLHRYRGMVAVTGTAT